MENDMLHEQMGMTGQNSFIMDRISSHALLSNSLEMNPQNLALVGYPILTSLQGEPIDNSRHDCRVISNQGGVFEFQEQSSLGETEICSNPFASLLATSSENLHNLAISSCSIFPGNVLRNYARDDVNSSIASDHVNDALGNMNKFQSFPSLENVDSNGWMTSSNGAIMSMDYPKCSNELSLSLASCQPLNDQAQCSEMSSSGVTRPYLNEPGFCVEQSSSKDLSLSFGSGQAPSQVILGSRYLHGIQEILAQVASFSLENFNSYSTTHMAPMRANASFSSTERGQSFCGHEEDSLDVEGRSEDQPEPAVPRRELEAKKTQLLTLLELIVVHNLTRKARKLCSVEHQQTQTELVDDQYSQCLDEIHTVVSAFHAATKLDPQVHTRFALQTISFLYKNLRERISSQILALGEHFNTSQCAGTPETSFIHKQWALQQLKKKDQLWRPQRGLPERSVSVLRAWMFQNFLHPYPKDSEKHLLAMKSGLSRSQVSNWFINARVRLWKPMIEEMYAEMNRRKARRNEEENNNNRGSQLIDINHQRFNV